MAYVAVSFDGIRVITSYSIHYTQLYDFAGLFGITTPMALASDAAVKTTGTERLVELCAAQGADVYLTGTGSRDYLDESLFAARGIRVEWQSFAHPVYPQLHGEFTSGLSALDCLMLCGGWPAAPGS